MSFMADTKQDGVGAGGPAAEEEGADRVKSIFVMPGDDVTVAIEEWVTRVSDEEKDSTDIQNDKSDADEDFDIDIGTGLHQPSEGRVVACKTGILRLIRLTTTGSTKVRVVFL